MLQHQLCDDQIHFYEQNGYLVIPGALDRDEILKAHRAIDEITEEQRPLGEGATKLEWEPELVDGKRIARRIYRAIDLHDEFRKIALSDKVLDPIESLLGPNIQLFSGRINIKAAHVGSVVEWHQDIAYVPHTNTSMLACLIYFDDATAENGCVQVIPGVHRNSLMSHSRDDLFVGKITDPIPSVELPARVLCEAPAGSVILIHCMTPHSSLPNESDRPRRTMVCDYRAADAYPIFFPKVKEVTSFTEMARQVRGAPSRVARFSLTSFPIPWIQEGYRSLYEVQERDRLAASQGLGTG